MSDHSPPDSQSAWNDVPEGSFFDESAEEPRAGAPSSAGPGNYALPSQQPRYADQRQHARYLYTRPILATPVLPDGSPDLDRSTEGLAIDISAGGMGVELPTTLGWGGKTLVVGVETSDSAMAFATALVRHECAGGVGVRLGLKFAGAQHDLFRAERVLPILDPASLQFGVAMPQNALTQWMMLGVLRPMLLDWVEVCYSCQGLLTFRPGCRQCGSSRTAAERFIHHFACAYIGRTHEFEDEGGLKCPKCRALHLIVGSDFEFLDGPHTCLDCNWSGTERERIAQCLRCRLRFPAHRAIEKELIGYHVCRLDPLALVAGP